MTSELPSHNEVGLKSKGQQQIQRPAHGAWSSESSPLALAHSAQSEWQKLDFMVHTAACRASACHGSRKTRSTTVVVVVAGGVT